MSNEKLTPKQAFEAVKILWPSVAVIKKANDGGWTGYHVDNFSYVQGYEVLIDWGSSIQYPPLPEEWRDAVMPDDWGKEARFSDDKAEWLRGMISGYSALPDRNYRWWSGHSWYKHCQVKKEQA